MRWALGRLNCLRRRISAMWGYPGSVAVFVPPHMQPSRRCPSQKVRGASAKVALLVEENCPSWCSLKHGTKAVSFPPLLGIMGIIISLFLQPPQLPKKE